MDEQRANDPVETLTEVQRLRVRSHRLAHGGAWVPVGVLAALVLLSTLLYQYPWQMPNAMVADYPFWAGLPSQQRNDPVSYGYWMVGLPAAFALIAWWYRRRSRRVGMRVPWPLFIAVGLGTLLLIVVLLAIPTPPPADPNQLTAALGPHWIHGLATPLLAVTASLIALSWVERRRSLAFAGAWLGLLAWWQCAAGYGQIPGSLEWLFNGGGGPALGGNEDLPPGGMLILMTLPLLVFLLLVAVRRILAAVKRPAVRRPAVAAGDAPR